MKKILVLSAILFFAIMAAPAFAESPILPHRVIDAQTGTVIDFEGLLSRCAGADVVTLGENHDDPATHLVELAMLEGLYRLHGDVVLSMEMFERDVQPLMDGYLSGDIFEEVFLTQSRPWPNYDTDYRPLVEFARENKLPVIAANVPRQLASHVAEAGMDNADFSDNEKPYMARIFEAPQDAYWEAFAATMRMPGMEQMGVTEQTIQWYYQAQVLKDETMAESVAMASEQHPDSVVYHVAGAFHTADFLGTFPRIERDLPGADCISILVLPVDDLLAPLPEDTPKADFWILVLAPKLDESEMPEMPQMPPMPPESEGE